MKRLQTASIIILFILPLIASCTKNSFGNTPEEKIIGTWMFDKVKFKPSGDITYTDFSNAYSNCTVTFNANWTLSAYDAKSNITAIGTWHIDWYTKYDENDDSETTIYVLIGTMDNPDLGIINDVYWDNLVVKNNKLSTNDEKDGGKYKYDLVRL